MTCEDGSPVIDCDLPVGLDAFPEAAFDDAGPFMFPNWTVAVLQLAGLAFMGLALLAAVMVVGGVAIDLLTGAFDAAGGL